MDEGLWLLRPEMRFAVPDEEAEKQWKDAANFAQGLGDMVISAGLFNDATGQLMLDAAESLGSSGTGKAAARGEEGRVTAVDVRAGVSS